MWGRLMITAISWWFHVNLLCFNGTNNILNKWCTASLLIEASHEAAVEGKVSKLHAGDQSRAPDERRLSRQISDARGNGGEQQESLRRFPLFSPKNLSSRSEAAQERISSPLLASSSGGGESWELSPWFSLTCRFGVGRVRGAGVWIIDLAEWLCFSIKRKEKEKWWLAVPSHRCCCQ